MPTAPAVAQWRDLRHEIERHPAWWAAGLVAVGWLVLTVPAAADLLNVGGHPAVHHAGAERSRDGAGVWHHGAIVWAAMIAATMVPLMLPNARYLARRSTRRRRALSIVELLVGWSVPWVAVGVALTLLVDRIDVLPNGSVVEQFLLVATLGVAAAWQCSGVKRRSLVACHRRFAPPLAGLASTAATVRYGTQLGRTCVVSCWALMAAMAVASHHLVVVAGVAAVQQIERRRGYQEPVAAHTIPVIVTFGILALMLA